MKPVATLIACLAIAGLACGPASRGGSPQTQGDALPAAGGSVSVRVALNPFDWDMSYVGKAIPNSWGEELAYDSLLSFDAGPAVQYAEMVLQPALAERWEVSPDAKTYTFHLRKGAHFATLPPVNGRELTSTDVKWSYEYWSRTGWASDKKLPASQLTSLFTELQSVDTPDPYTAVVRFSEPFVPFISYAASNYNPIVPHEIYDEDGDLHSRIAGTGPFQLDTAASQKGTRWVYKKNPSYWTPDRPYLDEVRWVVMPDDAAAIAALQAKQIDILPNGTLDSRTVAELGRSAPDLQIYSFEQATGWHIYLNVSRPPFNDPRVRKALALSIDRDEFSLATGGVKSTWAPTGSMLGLFTDAEAHQIIKYDPDQARRLLVDAGYGNGLDLPFEMSDAYGNVYTTGHEIIQAQAKRVGFNLALKTIDQNSYSAKRKQGNFTINMLAGPCAALSEEYDANLYGCYHSGFQSNYGGVNDAELDKLLDAERAEVNPDKRLEILRNASRRLTEQVYAIDLVFSPRWEAWQPRLKGYKPHLGSKGQNLTNAWVTGGRGG